MNFVATTTKWPELSLAATFTQPFSSTPLSQNLFFYYLYKIPQAHVKNRLFINSPLLPKGIFICLRMPAQVCTQRGPTLPSADCAGKPSLPPTRVRGLTHVETKSSPSFPWCTFVSPLHSFLAFLSCSDFVCTKQ